MNRMTSAGTQLAVQTTTLTRRRDIAVRRLLRIPDAPPAGSRPDVHGAFTTSVVASAARCLLTYVVLPVLAPVVGVAAGVGPWIGIALAAVALGANIVSVRRFWLVDHRWRWAYTVVCAAVMALLVVLVAGDVAELAR